MIEYSILRNKYGVRKPSELFSPRLVSVLDFPGMPFNSVYHYLGSGTGDLGPSHDSLLLRRYTIPAMVDHVFQYDSAKGNPRKVAVSLVSYSREYHRKNFKMRPLRKWSSVASDKRTPIVVNYAIAAYGVRYINNFMTSYNRWYNKMHTVWNKINEIGSTSNRQHFIIFDLPPVFPALQDLKRAEKLLVDDKIPESRDSVGTESFSFIEGADGLEFEGALGLESFKRSLNESFGLEGMDSNIRDLPSLGLEGMTRPILEIFSTDEHLNFLDLYMWAGESRSSSLMSLLSPEVLDKVNLVFLEGGRISILNLSTFDKIVAKTKDLGPGQVKPLQAQRLLFRYLDKVFALRSQVVDFELPEDIDGDGEDKEVIETAVIDKEGDIVEEFDLVFDDTEESLTDDMIETLNKEMEEIEEEVPSVVEENLQEEKALETGKLTKEAVAKLNQGKLSLGDSVKEQLGELAESGAITAQEYVRLNKLSDKYKELVNPYTNSGSLEEFIEVPDEIEKVPENSKIPMKAVGILDKSVLGNTLQTMQKQYIREVMPRHVASCIINPLQKQGVTVQSYRIEPVRTAFDEYDIHTLSVVPTKGAPSTIRLKIPHVDDEGVMLTSGIRTRIAAQRTDLPIRKISSREVMLSSYYGKIMVKKAERATFNADRWLLNQIASRGMDNNDESVTDLRFYKSFSFDQKLPSIYSLLSTRFSGFITPEYEFFTNYDKLGIYFKEDEIKKWNNDKEILIARTKSGNPIVVDFKNFFYECTSKGLEPIGTIETLLDLNIRKRPIEILELDVFTKMFPLGLVLGFYIGLDNLITLLNADVRRVKRLGRNRTEIAPNEFIVSFNDEDLVFEKGNKLIEYIFGGFARWPNDIKRYSGHLFNKQDVYIALFERNGLTPRFIRELKQIFTMFIDPITKRNLELMNEPTEIVQLLIRATEMLLTMDYPSASDANWSRDRGYERIAGAAYTELSKAMRVFKSKTSHNARFEVNPQSVWMGIIQDPSNSLVEDSNPIHNAKETEIVVFGGTGGRGQRSMQGNHRAYDKTQMGTTSEATKDSGKVATIVYTTQDPKYDTIYGTSKRFNSLEDSPSRLLSTSVMLAPASDREDMKRSSFTSIQNSQTIACKGAQKMPLQTGSEITMAHRVGKLFATVADNTGEIVRSDGKFVVAEYADGTKTVSKLGKQFGVMAGMSTVHEIVTDLKVGDKVNKGDVLTWNKSFFERDRFNPTQVTFKISTLARVALVEKDVTFEDACSISEGLAKRLEADIPNVKAIRIKFEQNINGLVKVGDDVNVDSILCTIENQFGASSTIFDEKSRETLAELEVFAPRAGHEGRVEQIKVYYNGELEDMSESLQKITKASDRVLNQERELQGKQKSSGKVEPGFRVSNQAIGTDEAVIFITINNSVGMSGGDKLVFSNQMKSIVSYHVTEGVFETEDGEPIDAEFSYVSFMKRIVESGMVIGTTNTLLVEASKRIVSTYRGK